MASINQNDSFYANNLRTLEFTITDRDSEPEAPYDLTGKDLRWSCSRQLDDGGYSSVAVIIKQSAGSSPGIIIDNDPTTGKAVVTLNPSDTVKMLGKYHHELEVITGVGESIVVATGTLNILRNIGN